jgi:eukaryotic-like serine/threonine-protein kinase
VNSDRHQVVKRIFLEACRREPASRPEYVRQACEGDESLVREVEALLAHHTETTIIPSSPLDDTNRRRSKNSHRSRSRWSRGAVSRAFAEWAQRLGLAGQLALGAAAMMVVVFALAWWSQREVDRLNRSTWEDGLVKSTTTAHEVVRQWMSAEIHAVEAMQAVPSFRLALNQVLYSIPAERVPLEPPSRADLEAPIRKFAGDEAVYMVVNKRGGIAALGGTKTPPADVTKALATLVPEIARFRDTGSLVLLPHRCRQLAGDDWFGRNTPMIGVFVPIVDSAKQKIGAVFVASPARLESLNRTLESFRTQETGEAFLATRDGRMLNESRFRDDLIRAGILPPETRSTVLMSLHNPGVDTTVGTLPSQPYTTHVAPAPIAGIQAGNNGVNVDGFRDYRGVLVIGAWQVDLENDYGIVVKLDQREAFAAQVPLRRFFYARVAMILLATVLVLWSWYSATSARRRLKDVIHIGSYVLEGLIGEGGMGRVYKARHLLLKRTTAVKVIKPELVNDRTIAWFEREVEVAGKLKHPNTVEIYDFGRSDQGQFYCAMEFLNGLNLSQVGLMEGALPAERVIHTMLQAAHSLREAHRRGMIHRDVKPQNIMLCVLGGEVDVVKVLDFGLAKQYEPGEEPSVDTKMLAGTPLYLSPERLRPPYQADARSDIYSLGMTAYRLMTGRDVFSGGSDMEVFHQTLHMPVSDPTSISPLAIPPEFSELVLRCLSKNPEDRPQSMRDVISVLDRLALEYPWRQEEARRWWQLNAPRVKELAPYWDSDEELDWDAPTTPPPSVPNPDDPAPAVRNGDEP